MKVLALFCHAQGLLGAVLVIFVMLRVASLHFGLSTLSMWVSSMLSLAYSHDLESLGTMFQSINHACMHTLIIPFML